VPGTQPFASRQTLRSLRASFFQLRCTQELRKHYGVIDGGVFGCVEQRSFGLSNSAKHIRNGGIGLQFIVISAPELCKSFSAMIKPPSKGRGRRNLFGPKVERGGIFAQPSWP
jgi:hypothetical protein